jgi:hypothetical protein
MASNDLVLLNQLLDQRLSEIGQGLTDDEYFEVFSAEQVLKDDDLSYEELASGIIDGGGDGGVDSLYFFVNGVPFNEELDIASHKKGVRLRMVLIQSKTSPGFSESAIEKMISSARDLFDLNKDPQGLVAVYNQDLIKRMLQFRKTFLDLASKFPSVGFEYAYVTKGIEVHPNVERKVQLLEQTIKSFFNPVSFSFKFLKAADLLASARRSPSSTTSIRLAENPISTGQEGFVCLVTLRDYLAFITDDDGHLRSHLFEGNVRDYQGKTEVNMEIRRTLETAAAEDFWWLNNGVSIICTNASLSGKTLTIEDAEIVNGLQSSREIYNALHGKDLSKEPRNLLVRVLKPQSQESRDRIIKATNSQTPIPAASLRATDKIHRDIEDYLYNKGYFYDRRKNYYKNIGKPIKRIFGIPFVAQSVMACALTDPANARARPSSLIKSEDAYKRIFSSDYPLDIYLKCPLVVQSVAEVLKLSGKDDYRKHANNILFYVATLWVLHQSRVPRPSVQQIASLNISALTFDTILPVAAEVWDEYAKLGGTDQVAKGTELSEVLLERHRQQAVQAITKSAASLVIELPNEPDEEVL